MSPVERVPVPHARVPDGATNAYLVGEHDSPQAGLALVDPAGRHERLDDAIGDVAHVLVTHTHPDHVGALAHYARESDATVWAHAPHADRLEDATGVTPDRTFRDGDTVGPLTALATPGHARDHVAFAVGDDYLVGDLVRANGSVAIGRDGDLRAYLTGLRRLAARHPLRLHPGHGPPVDAPRERIADAISHRNEREERVLDAVQRGAQTLDAVLDAAYDTDLGDARRFAATTVAAHLRKLAVEGDVSWDGERATPA